MSLSVFLCLAPNWFVFLSQAPAAAEKKPAEEVEKGKAPSGPKEKDKEAGKKGGKGDKEKEGEKDKKAADKKAVRKGKGGADKSMTSASLSAMLPTVRQLHL